MRKPYVEMMLRQLLLQVNMKSLGLIHFFEQWVPLRYQANIWVIGAGAKGKFSGGFDITAFGGIQAGGMCTAL